MRIYEHSSPLPHLILLKCSEAPKASRKVAHGLPAEELDGLVAHIPVRSSHEHERGLAAARLIEAWSHCRQEAPTASRWRELRDLLRAAPPGPWVIDLAADHRSGVLRDTGDVEFAHVRYADGSRCADVAGDLASVPDAVAEWLSHYCEAVSAVVNGVIIDAEKALVVEALGPVSIDPRGVARVGDGSRLVDHLFPEAVGRAVTFTKGGKDLRRESLLIGGPLPAGVVQVDLAVVGG